MAYLKMGNITARTKGNKSEGLKDALDYIFNPKKTESYALIGGYNLIVNAYDEAASQKAYAEMLETKEYFDKLDGRQGYHYKLSFPEGDNVTPELALKITNELCEKVFTHYECAYSVHTNSKYLHSHIVFNSIDLVDGYKYRYKKGDWAKNIQPVANEICKKYNLASLSLDLDEKFNMKCMNYAKWQQKNADNIKYTNAMIKADVDECIEKATNYEEFINLMQAKGHIYDDSHKYITVLAPGRTKVCRLYNLTEDKRTYTKDNIKRMINGSYLTRDDIRHKLAEDYDVYVADKYKIRHVRYSPEVAKFIEMAELIIDKQLMSEQAAECYMSYLEQADKELNIMRKKIQNQNKERQEVLVAVDEIKDLLVDYFKYKKGDYSKKEKYDRCVYLMNTHIVDKGYNLVSLYKYKVTSELLINNINDYKKHLYVEKKICQRALDLYRDKNIDNSGLKI